MITVNRYRCGEPVRSSIMNRALASAPGFEPRESLSAKRTTQLKELQLKELKRACKAAATGREQSG
jgi:hypothetical protein